MDFKSYSDGCKKFKVINPYENERAFNRAYGITELDTMPPLFIQPKSAKSKTVQPTLQAHVRLQAIKQ